MNCTGKRTSFKKYTTLREIVTNLIGTTIENLIVLPFKFFLRNILSINGLVPYKTVFYD